MPEDIDLNYVNLKEGMRILNNNVKLYTRLLENFSQSGLVEEFAAAVECKDVKTSELKAHTLKGVSANLSLTALFKVSERLDTGLKAGALPTPQDMAEVKDAFAKTLNYIKAVTAAPEIVEKYK
jgi:HPt (histidine-containing phosphotransfer) domain-containing protein